MAFAHAPGSERHLIDCDHRTPPAQEQGYPYVTIPQLKNGRIDLSSSRRISPEHYVEWTRKAKPSAFDVVLSRRCNPGETAFVPPDVEFALGQNLVLLRADGSDVYREEIAFMQAVRTILTKQDPTTSLSDDAKEHALRQILSRAVVSAEVMDIFKAAGLDRPDVSILSDEFLEDVRRLKEKNLAVEILERLLKGQIKSRFGTNVVQCRKFSELLQDSVIRYRNRAIETTQVIEELIAMAEEFRAAANRGEKLGLTRDEMAFYDALAANEASVRELGDATLRKIARELTEKLRASNSVDWYVRESVRAKLRLMVKTILKKSKYPSDGQEKATETVLEQAQELSAAWAAA